MSPPSGDKQLRLRIVHKGLALILLPVLLQLGCILWLYALVEKTEKLAVAEATYAQAADLTATVILEAGQAASFGVRKMSRGEPDVGSLEADRTHIAALAQEVRQLMSKCGTVGVPAELSERLDRDSSQCLVSLYRVMKGINVIAGSGNSLVDRLPLFKGLEPVESKLEESLKRVNADADELRLALTRARRDQTIVRKQMKTQILIAITVEVVMTIATVVLFLKNITDRLKILVENARLIPSEQPLVQSVPGTDELSYLDKVLHDASLSLHRAAEHKRSLMQMVAHDLRGPLAAARILTEHLIEKARVREPEFTPELENLQRACSLVIGFVEDLLTLDKLEAGKLELDWDSVELPVVVHESVQQLAPLAERKNIVIVEESCSGRVLADRRRLMQVLNNLLSNAIKYSPEHSSITIGAERDGTKTKVWVRDCGPGIPPHKQEHLFDKYYQVDGADSSKGFGLGLAICHLIVTAHDGSIGVESAPGKGSTFWFTLPRDSAAEDDDDTSRSGSLAVDPTFSRAQ